MSTPDLSQLIPILTPLLPYLLKMGEQDAEEMGQKIGGADWEQAKALWERLRGKEKVQSAARAASALPDNPAIQQGLMEEILRALKEDPALLTEAARRLPPADLRRLRPATKVTSTASGTTSAASGGRSSPLREKAVREILNLLSAALQPLYPADLLTPADLTAGLDTWTLEDVSSG